MNKHEPNWRLIVTIDTGQVIYGADQSGTLARTKMEEMMSNINDFALLKLDTPTGAVYIPQGILQRSYFEIENLD